MIIWHVYQLRSDTELLYVGYTRRLAKRLGAHRSEKPWWPEVTSVKTEDFASEDEARQREKDLWACEHPKYNKASPFLTPEEGQEQKRERDRKRDARRDRREYHRMRNRTPGRRAYNARLQRNARAPRQAGPGLW